MSSNQKPSLLKGWMWLVVSVVIGFLFLAILYYCVSSDNNDIDQYAKQWRSTGDNTASMPMDMSNMNHADMPASEMQHMDMAEMHKQKN